MEIKLLPCPFCGGEAGEHSWRDAIKETREVPLYRNDEGVTVHTQEFVIAKATIGEVHCSSCGATIRSFGDIDADRHTIRQMAVDAWNTRYEMPCSSKQIGVAKGEVLYSEAWDSPEVNAEVEILFTSAERG